MQDDKIRLRNEFLKIRRNVRDRNRKNAEIFESVISLNEYINADTVLCYVSVRDEPDTLQIIDHSIEAGKTVGVPVCISPGIMEFRTIRSLNDLKKGSFGIPEPDADSCPLADITDNTLCIVPGVVFDRTNQRIGYGGGYYDRFLSSFSGYSAGICFSDCITDYFEHGNYDIRTDTVITDGVR